MKTANMKTANIYARIEPKVKKKAENILNNIGIPASVAINMYYKQIILTNGIPFKLSATMPDSINLDVTTKEEFDKDMEKRYKAAKAHHGIEANKYFANFNKVKV